MDQLARTQQGITLIEVMIVTTIIGILALIGIGAYQDYTVRSQVSEGVNLANPARTAVAEGYQANSMSGVAGAANSWTFNGTKYVSNISIDPATGIITVLFNGANNPRLSTYTITLTPQINVNGTYTLLAGVGTATGGVDWACSSANDQTATVQTSPPMQVPVPGTLPPQWAPTQCK